MTENTPERWDERFISIVKIYTKKLRLLKVNRELLVFFVFLCIASIFWLLQAFRENATTQLHYNLHFSNFPEEMVITSDIPKQISATIAGRGYDLMTYTSEENTNLDIIIDYSELSKGENSLFIDNATLKRLISKNLSSYINLVSVSPSQITLQYSNGEKKKVPVVYPGNATTGSQYSLCSINIKPDSVEIYAPENLYKSVNYIYTQNYTPEHLEKTQSIKLPLNPQNGVKCIPDSVDVTFNVELYTEKTLLIPISGENLPNGTILHTFPSKAKLTCRVSANRYHDIKEKDFKISVDNNDLEKGEKKCRLIILEQPTEVHNIKLHPESVEYIIEQTNIH